MSLTIATFPPCRAHDLYWPLEDHPVALQRNPADEAYWLDWDHSFGGEATIRIARLDDQVTVSRRYRTARFGGKIRCRYARLTMSDWLAFEDAVVAANFWMLGECIPFDMGCDGANWMIAGLRGRDFHYIKRWSPHGVLRDLGRLLFDLAGLNEVRL
jgi:hypothetical protein